MEDTKILEMDTAKEVKDGEVESAYTPEEIEAREKLFDAATEILKGYGLEWTFRSINYIVNKENITFNQLRSCVFKGNEGFQYDYIKAVMLLIKAGLVGSNQISDTKTKELEDRAYEIIEDWRCKFGYLGTLHILIINQMEQKHFFMGSQDLGVLEYLSYQNLQRDLVKTQMALSLEEKMSQARALQ